MQRVIRAAIVTLTIVAAQSGSAQGTATGKWIFEFNRRVTEENNVVTESDPARVRLTIDVAGDSVTGSWQLIGSDGIAVNGPVRFIHGHVSNGRFRIETEPPESVLRGRQR
jgi:hypothetical protein